MSFPFLATMAKHLATCSRFQGAPEKFYYAYGRVLRRVNWSLPGRRSSVRVRLRGHQHPFHVRLSSTDWLVLEEIFHRGEYSIVPQHVGRARFIVDLGANAGFSLRYWETLFPGIRILAVEPDPANCRACERNICAASMNGRVNLVRGAVGARRCQAELTQAGGEWGYQVRGGEDAQGIPVDIYPMEELLSTGASAQTVDLLKCDIEGAEREVFANCGAWIGRVSAMVIELHPPYGLAQLQADLCQAGARFRVVELAEGKALPVAFLKNLDLPINATTKATCVVAELPVLPKTSKRALV